jgi:hypothetical protein
VTPKSRRTFSKRLVALNVVLAWIAVFTSVYYGTSEVAVSALAMIAALGGTYMGVGYMDLKAIVGAIRGNPDYGTTYTSNDSGSPSQSS